MDKATRSAIERATQQARKLLDDDFSAQLEGTFDVLRSGVIAPKGGAHLSARQQFQRGKIVAAIDHKRAAGMSAVDAITDYVRDAAFTALNRFVALKMLEARQLVQESITKGEQSAGYKEFCGMAPALALLPDGFGYRLYVESLFDEFSTEIKVLFDRRDTASVLWPKRQTFEALLAVINAPYLSTVWGEDETIGWVYQFFNSSNERKEMRDASSAPRNSRELAVRNQFFTPRYIVQFLVDNTLGRTWIEMQRGKTSLVNLCEYFCRSADQLLIERSRKDPRDIRVLDPACGSGHFLLYSFDLLLTIYEEAWSAEGASPPSETTERSLRDDYPELADLRRAAPRLIVEHNLHGVDIDPRCAQIAALTLWLRAQRAWKDLGIGASNRPRISRTHIVVAEPMPGDELLVEEFSARLEPPLLRDLFKKMIAESQLAGELGTLLCLEHGIADDLRRAREQFIKQGQTTGFLPGMEPLAMPDSIDLSGIDEDTFFHEAEIRIIDALRTFAEISAGSIGLRRRLFAEDAAQGIALLDLVRIKFDVVLMNPPFGDATLNTVPYLEAKYPRTRLDLFAAFCERALALTHPNGIFGAITPRDGFFKKTLTGWRDLVLEHHLSVVADLGLGVLDAATVRVAAYVISKSKFDQPSHFIDLVDIPQRESRLLEEIRQPQRCFNVVTSNFRALPLSRFLYWLPKRLWEIYSSAEPLENHACTPRYGLTTLNDERFCRLFYELDPKRIGQSASWVFMSKGGDDYPFGGVSNTVVKWENNAAEMAEVNRQSNGQIAQTRRASKYYFRPAISFSNRSVQFSARWHPANYAFSVRGPAVIPIVASQAYILGFFNSRLVRALIQMQTASQTYTSGVLKELRWVEPSDSVREIVEIASTKAFAECRIRLATVESDPFFCGLVTFDAKDSVRTVAEYFEWRRNFESSLNDTLHRTQSEIDVQIAGLYGVTDADVERCERSESDDISVVKFPPTFSFALTPEEALASFLFGIAFGRWSPSSVGYAPMLDASAPESQPASAREFPERIVLVDDAGHADDLGAAVTSALRSYLPDTTDSDESLIERALGAASLRQWYARTFFTRHLVSYSGFGRAAPVYWQLATPSASYSVWLHIRALSTDTLFRVQNDYIAPKLAFEERQLRVRIQDSGQNPSAKERKEIAAHQAFVEELRTLLEEVKLVAPMWNPVLEDGVALTMAPLWRLVPQHKSWQKELKSKWEELASGACDWAQIAMNLWPERVVLKCAIDRSLAIAHGLESVFWIVGDDGKAKAQPNPLRPVDELVRERTSAGVKAALQEFIRAALPTGSGGTRRSA
jgi:hypothetical protein